jgi:hypothetical protein
LNVPKSDIDSVIVEASVVQVVDSIAKESVCHANALAGQCDAAESALNELERVRALVGDPAHLVGSSLTKHGEIAEIVDVHVRNAYELVQQRPPVASFENIERNGHIDYRLGGEGVQSKFLNGPRNTLAAVQEHMANNSAFGSEGSFYVLPKDQYEVVTRIRGGEEVSGFAERTIRAIADKAAAIETAAGRPFNEAVQPSVSTYAEVQQGRVHDTLADHERALRLIDQERTESLRRDAEPTAGDVGAMALQGAAVGAALRLSATLLEKVKQGRNPLRGEFTAQDWADLGLATGKGAAQGGVSAGAIFALTQFRELSAPFAGAVVSSALAFAPLTQAYRAGRIGVDELVEQGQIVCFEAGMVAAATLLGQAVIPIPAFGAVVGSLAGRLVIRHCKRWLSAEEASWMSEAEAQYSKLRDALDEQYATVVTRLTNRFDELGDLTSAAFDVGLNSRLKLETSVALAQSTGVEDSHIVRTTADLDRFMAA